MIRPRLRLPLWVIMAVAGAGYLVRAYLRRGGDMSPDLPSDAIVGAALVFIVVTAWVLRVQDVRAKRRENEAGKH